MREGAKPPIASSEAAQGDALPGEARVPGRSPGKASPSTKLAELAKPAKHELRRVAELRSLETNLRSSTSEARRVEEESWRGAKRSGSGCWRSEGGRSEATTD